MEELINKLKEFKASKGDKDAEEMEETIKEAIEQLQEKDKIILEIAKAFKQDDIRNVNEIIEYFTKKAREV